MAALNRVPSVRVRAAAPGEGAALARLWRELWEAHEGWGGYGASRDARVYAEPRRPPRRGRARPGRGPAARPPRASRRRARRSRLRAGRGMDRPLRRRPPHALHLRGALPRRRSRGPPPRRGSSAARGPLARVVPRGARGAARARGRGPRREPRRRLLRRPRVRLGRLQRAHRGRGRRRAPRRFAPPARLASRVATPAPWRASSRPWPPGATPPATGATTLPLPSTWRSSTAIEVQLEARGESTQRDPTTLVAVDASGNVCGLTSFATHALEPPFSTGVRALAGRFAVGEGWRPRAILGALVGPRRPPGSRSRGDEHRAHRPAGPGHRPLPGHDRAGCSTVVPGGHPAEPRLSFLRMKLTAGAIAVLGLGIAAGVLRPSGASRPSPRPLRRPRRPSRPPARPRSRSPLRRRSRPRRPRPGGSPTASSPWPTGSARASSRSTSPRGTRRPTSSRSSSGAPLTSRSPGAPARASCSRPTGPS